MKKLREKDWGLIPKRQNRRARVSCYAGELGP